MDGSMAPAAYVPKDGLVGHQWKERPLVLPRLDPQCRCIWGAGGNWVENTIIEEVGYGSKRLEQTLNK